MLARIKFLIMTSISGLAAIYIAIQAYRKGKQAGSKAVIKEHEAIITKIEEKEEKKHGITQENVVDRLNDRFH
ncbi:hypothetical protein PVA44_07815 (plasmid) [Entomospira nematocerorum]|uniref:Uncharacterized protein n=1 Tax=Entomospira nematocerorum TaxID=2719987 RepID=A0A968GDK4_9SPIO|nr:hypothetical protein [Entomospira nematocera]NIZ47819.1 hypothetical protein [Entomospira nematocera]WDI34752.1 hypothetical protein PVA44_07815 [Entomospira nematocera]